MRFQCPWCGSFFENQLEECPACHKALKYIRPSAKTTGGKEAAPPSNLSKEAKSQAIDQGVSNMEVVAPSSAKESEDSGVNSAFNVFWFLIFGLWSVIWNVLYGISLCLTIIGIPSGIMCFKFIPVVAMPAGKEVMIKFSSHPFLNAIQLIFGGLVSYFICMTLCLVFFATIVGIPFGKQLHKIAKFFLAPFGSRVVYINQYTDNRDTLYDLCYFLAQIHASNKEVVLSDGRRMLASRAMKETLGGEEKELLKSKLHPSDSSLAGGEEDSESGSQKPDFSFLKLSSLEYAASFLFWVPVGAFLVLTLTLTLVCALTSGSVGAEFLKTVESIVASLNGAGRRDWLYLFLLLGLPILVMMLLVCHSLNRAKKLGNSIMPFYLAHWKNITYYYPDKAERSLIYGRKNKNLYKSDDAVLEKYQYERTIDDMLWDILSD